MFYIYVIQNKTNNKLYVGKAANPSKRFIEHKNISNGSKPREHSLIHSAIAKYKVDNFTFQVIEEWGNETEAYEAEKFWIEFFRSNVSKFGKNAGYNLNEGGLGAGAGNNNPMFGKHHSPETIIKMSQDRIGKGNAMFGRKHTDQSKKLMADVRFKYVGEKNPRAKLTNEIAEEIRREFSTGTISRKELAVKYNVRKSIIERIITNQTYRSANNG